MAMLWVTEHPGFSTQSPASQETPWSLANWDGGFTSCAFVSNAYTCDSPSHPRDALLPPQTVRSALSHPPPRWGQDGGGVGCAEPTADRKAWFPGLGLGQVLSSPQAQMEATFCRRLSGIPLG